MKRYVIAGLAAVLSAFAAGAAEPLNVSVLENAVLCLRASRVPENVTEQVQAAAVPKHLAGTVLDLRFATDAAPNAADYFLHGQSPLVILINSQTSGAAAALATQLRTAAAAILIGSTNPPGNLLPDVIVTVSADEEKAFQNNPFFKPTPVAGVAPTNLLAFVDHTSEADLVRKRVKDGEQDGDSSSPRAEPAQPVIRDPALARAMDLLKALAALQPAPSHP